MADQEAPAPFVTFYSFKGGVGRSMALINTAGILAGRGFRVLVIDLDLEAPGLSYLDPNKPDASVTEHRRRTAPTRPGFVDLISDAKRRGQEADLFTMDSDSLASHYTQPYHLPEDLREFEDGSLHIMPAGRFDEGYADRFDALNLGGLYHDGLGEPLMRAFKKRFAEAGLYDYVLIDSRTGFSDEAGICTRDLADHLMILSGLNRQNVEGTCQFLHALKLVTADKPRSFDVILSPIPNGEDALVDRREAAARAAFEEVWGAPIRLDLQIPYHPQLALTEEPHIFRRRRGYLFQAYHAIERRLLRSLKHDAPSLRGLVSKQLEHKNYAGALQELRRLVRVDKGRTVTLDFLRVLLSRNLRRRNDADESRIAQHSDDITNVVASAEGRRLTEFLIEHLPFDELSLSDRDLVERLEQVDLDLADRFYRGVLEALPGDSKALSEYAQFLELKRNDDDSALTFFKRALEADPRDSVSLQRYAVFLERQGQIAPADVLYRRAIESDPDWFTHGTYARFLERREDFEGAEASYKRAIEHSAPAVVVAEYARFLDQRRGQPLEAESYYRRALEKEPENFSAQLKLGQLLISSGRYADAALVLSSASERYENLDADDAADLAFSNWILKRLQGIEAVDWERRLKGLILRGFPRYEKHLDRLLMHIRRSMGANESKYAEALGNALLSQSKVHDLERFARWRDLAA